jgi:hypothetical protein
MTEGQLRAILEATLECAIFPPVKGKAATGQIPWRRIYALRDALEAGGIDWRAVKVEQDLRDAERRAREARA